MFLSCLAMFVFSLGLSGCPSGGETTQPASGGGAAADHGHDHDDGHEHAHDEGAGHEHGAEMAASTEVPEGLAELSDEDRAAAVEQKICPVSGEPLGSMGTPVKVTVKEREVFLCCAGCEGAITEDPDKYLAKLDE
jgi:hypothetical protein